jgi:hypothetical protein
MKQLQKDLRGITYIFVPQLEVYKECQGCCFAKRGDLCEEIGIECTLAENRDMVWEVKKDRI